MIKTIEWSVYCMENGEWDRERAHIRTRTRHYMVITAKNLLITHSTNRWANERTNE